jgi:hypothetical protein
LIENTCKHFLLRARSSTHVSRILLNGGPHELFFFWVYAAVINFKNAEAGAKALQQAQNVGFYCELLSEKRYLPAPLASPFPMNLLLPSPLLVLQSAT